MPLTELHAANDLLDDPPALAARHQQEGCLFIRAGIDPAGLADVAEQAGALLERWGVARRGDGVRATGASLDALDALDAVDPAELQRLPALVALAEAIAAGTDPISPVAARAFGCPTALWPGARLHLAFPGDAAAVTPPHQDSGALDWIGDYRRLWIALGDIPFGDGGLGLATGSHRYRRLRMDELLDGSWSTAEMSIGDLFTFDLNLVHRSLPATSDRIRIALTVVGSAQWDPRPSVAADDAGELQLGLCEREASPAAFI
ncbi:MAG TPA: phytanoyl-CoA dioxygenase family protein [Solirubrobacteraceae bacterium]|nr:phytanoyl-CoA dioxygenase family protein [Solirubrobacteraceae bacterium]